MKVVHFYSIKGKAWVSPGELWAALTSKEEIKILKHGLIYGVSDAILEALDVIDRSLRARRKHAIGVTLIGLGLTLFLEWPVIHMLNEFRRGIQALCFTGVLVGLFNIIQATRALKTLNKTPTFAEAEEGLAFPPPATAYREVVIGKPKLAIPIVVLIASLILNSVVLATYKTPAVVWAEEPYLVDSISLVPPWIKWEQKPRIIRGMEMAYFTMEGDDYLWIVRAEYSMDSKDPFQDIEEAKNWLANILNYFVDNIATEIHISIPENATQEERVALLAKNIGSPEIIDAVQAGLVNWFGQKYTNLSLQWVKVTVEKIKVTEYQSYLRTKQ